MVMDEVKKKDHVHDVSSLINFRNLTFTELNNTRAPLTKALDTLADINPRAVSALLQRCPRARPYAYEARSVSPSNHRPERVGKHWVAPGNRRRTRSLRRTRPGGSFAGTGEAVVSRCNRLAQPCIHLQCYFFCTAGL